MQATDPKKDQSNMMTGEAQNGASPLDRYTATPAGDSGAQSPYYQSQAPSITMPKGGGAIKGIDEKFTVNAVNGTAALSIPLPLTPGRAGFTPGLSLQYNSGSGNSEFGLGWGLSLPAIQRKTDKKLPQYKDDVESDVFLLAGAEDLVPLLRVEDDEWMRDVVIDGAFTIKRYRPRIEGLFARIELIIKDGHTDSWWKVTTKDNVVTFYGLTEEARVADPEDASRIFRWLPQLCYDNKGNVQQYNYVTDNNPEGIPAALHERNRASGLAPCTNTYLKSVAYCNTTPFFPSHNYQPELTRLAEGDTTGLTDVGYMMQAVLDYGNHDADAPTPYDPVSTWPVRKDAFSDFHAGFEVRTYRMCRRVLMFHYFPEIFEGSIPMVASPYVPSCLVRSLDLEYLHDGDADAYVDADLVSKATQTGYRLKASGGYTSKSLPAMIMDYNSTGWNTTVHNVALDNTEHAPQGLTGSYQWTDLWGEGLPGILTEQDGSWYYKRNLGNGQFGHAVAVAERPSLQGLGGGLQWQDLDGDGRRQLVSRASGLPGYYELDDDQQWQDFRAFNDNINIDWASPYTRMLDLNGDGRPDVLLTEERAWRWYENKGTDGFAEGGYGSTAYDEEKAPRLLLNDMLQVIYLADMNGDGLTDIVRIQNGEVCYWPNMGYGKFGARVTMSDAPLLDTQDGFNPQYVTLADIGGTGAPDMLYIKGDTCTVYTNQAGNAWSLGRSLLLPQMEQYSRIALIDLLGNGTTCLVWSSPLPQHAWAPMRYIALADGYKPYLMNAYHNGMGKTVGINYRSSVNYYLRDMQEGTPWATRLPFPVHCISTLTTSDVVSETSYTQIYRYHHGYYDHEEREFRGFGRVDVIDTDVATAYTPDGAGTNNLDQASVLTRTWYHTGAWMREGTLLDTYAAEYYSSEHPAWRELENVVTLGDIESSWYGEWLTAEERREAYRSIKGQLLRQEIYALDGTEDATIPFVVNSSAYRVRINQPRLSNRFAVFYSYSEQSLSITCERKIDDVRITHEIAIHKDAFGNDADHLKIVYPRYITTDIATTIPTLVANEQAKMQVLYTRNRFGNCVWNAMSQITTGGYRHSLPYENMVMEVSGLDFSGSLVTYGDVVSLLSEEHPATFTDVWSGSGQFIRLLAHKRIVYYADDAHTILSLGSIEPLGIFYREYKLAINRVMLQSSNYYDGRLTDDMLTEGGYVREDTLFPPFPYEAGQDERYWMPGGRIQYYNSDLFFLPAVYYDAWDHNPTFVHYAYGSINGYYLLPVVINDDSGTLSTVNKYNWYNLQPERVTDINNNQSHLLYDALGLPVSWCHYEQRRIFSW